MPSLTPPLDSSSPRVRMGLAEQAAFLNSVLESSTEYSIVAEDLDGHILAWNEGARRIYGYEPEDVVGKSAFLLHDPDDRESGRAQAILDEARSSGKWSGALNRVRKNGSKFRAFVTITLRRDARGVATGFTMISRDLTESERRDRELRESREYDHRLIESNLDALMTTDAIGVIADANCPNGQTAALARAIASLSVSERRYRQLFDTSPIPKLVCDSLTLQVIDANESAVARYGYPLEHLLTLRLPDLHPPEDRARLEAYVTSRTRRSARASEWRQCARNGETFEVELTCSPIAQDVGAAILVVAYDISERKAADALFRAAVEVSPSGLIMVDGAETIRLVNRQVEAIFGFREDELVGRSVEMLLPEALRSAHATHRGTFVEHPSSRQMGGQRFLFGVHKDGHQVPTEIGLAPVSRDKQTFVLASVIDISERRRAEQSINEAASRWRAMMESAMDGVSIISLDGTILETNQRMAEILARPVDQIVGQSVSAFTLAAEASDSIRAFGEAVARGSGHVLGATLMRPDGTRVIVDFAMSTVAVGGDTAILSIGRDVTQQRMLEQQYRQAQKMEAVGRLAGGVAHDFNNLLTAIIGYAGLLSEDLPESSPALADVEEIKTAAKRAAALTRQLLAFSRQQVLSPTVLNPNTVVEEVEKLLERLIGEDISLVTVLDPDAGNVFADHGQLEQVLMNLAVNARDAMPTGGTLTIETAEVEFTAAYAATHQPSIPGRYVMLAVTDTGIGISEEVRARMFEPFFTTKEQGKGTGLGLATVYGIVKQSGGFIWVYGEPGIGATFKVYLPRVHDEADESVIPAPPSPRELRGGETILFVEDDELLRPLTREVLGRYGYSVLEARNAVEAMRVSDAHEGDIQLLVTDMVMPGDSGRVLAERLVAKRPSMRVLFVSGYTDEAIIRSGRLERGNNFLEKPFAPETLALKIREILR